jgi:phage tail-like protein
MKHPLYNLSVSHRFTATFWLDKFPLPSVIDTRFQRIRGLSRELKGTLYSEGGENLRNQFLTEKIEHGSLVLERGVMMRTPFSELFNFQLLSGKTLYLSAIVSLFDHEFLPLTNWLITRAVPVRWQTGDMDAQSNQIFINTFELRYEDMIPIGVKL